MTVRRFTDSGQGGMLEHPDGHWVTWEDHAAEVERLEQRAQTLEDINAALRSQLAKKLADWVEPNVRQIAREELALADGANALEIEQLRADRALLAANLELMAKTETALLDEIEQLKALRPASLNAMVMAVAAEGYAVISAADVTDEEALEVVRNARLAASERD